MKRYVSMWERAEPAPALNWPARFLVASLIMPLLVVACVSGPQAETGVVQDPRGTAGGYDQTASPPLDPLAYYHFIVGFQAEQNQDTDRAIQEYQLALRGDPASIGLKARLAGLYFAKGDAARAVRYADRIATADVREPALLMQLAGIYAGAEQPDRALNLYDSVIERNPLSHEAVVAKGVLLVNLKRFEEAERVFEQAAVKNHDSPIGFYYLGRIGLETKQYAQAIAHLERALAINPAFDPAYHALAGHYESQQQRTQAIGVYRRYLQQANPHNKEVRQHVVRLLLAEKLYGEALADLEQALKEDPDDLDAQLRIGLVYGEMKEYAKAVEILNKILAVRPAELRVRDYLGLMYEEQKDFPKAQQAYEDNLRLQPGYADGHMHLGFLLYRSKRYSAAITHFSEAVKLNPKHPDAHLLLGLTYQQSEQYEKASQAFEEGIRQNPSSPDLHFNLGTAYDKLNRFDDVVRAMETALKLDPKHADALNYLGYSYAERGIKIDEAITLTERAVALKPNNGYYVDSLGWALFKMGNLDRALVHIKEAVKLVGDDPVIYEHLGEVYLKQNLAGEAREAWLRSLELDPSNTKLMDRFRTVGLGDPSLEERIIQAKRRISESAHARPNP